MRFMALCGLACFRIREPIINPKIDAPRPFGFIRDVSAAVLLLRIDCLFREIGHSVETTIVKPEFCIYYSKKMKSHLGTLL
jgi:hypothetical protein